MARTKDTWRVEDVEHVGVAKEVVAVLDPRLDTARYGFPRASLPPFRTTCDPEVVRAALKRLDAAQIP